MLGAVLAAVVLAVTMTAGAVGSAVVARHRAQGGADLAALAAAAVLPAGADAACDRAAGIARAMHAAVVDCETDGLDVTVTVEVPVHLGRWGLRAALAAARAGPANSTP